MGYVGASPIELNGKLCSIVTFGIPIGLHYFTCIASYHATDATAAGHRSTSSAGVEVEVFQVEGKMMSGGWRLTTSFPSVFGSCIFPSSTFRLLIRS